MKNNTNYEKRMWVLLGILLIGIVYGFFTQGCTYHTVKVKGKTEHYHYVSVNVEAIIQSCEVLEGEGQEEFCLFQSIVLLNERLAELEKAKQVTEGTE